MNTAFLLMAQYNGQAIIPLEKVCEDYFRHLIPKKFLRKVMAGEIDLLIVRMGRVRRQRVGASDGYGALPGCAASD